MNDHARASRQHRRQEGTIQPHGREQVEVEGTPPLVVTEGREAARRCGRPSDDVDDDVYLAQPIADRRGHGLAPRGRGHVGGYEEDTVHGFGRSGARRRQNHDSRLSQARGHRRADALGPARHQSLPASDVAVHRISNETIFPPSTANRC